MAYHLGNLQDALLYDWYKRGEALRPALEHQQRHLYVSLGTTTCTFETDEKRNHIIKMKGLLQTRTEPRLYVSRIS